MLGGFAGPFCAAETGFVTDYRRPVCRNYVLRHKVLLASILWRGVSFDKMYKVDEFVQMKTLSLSEFRAHTAEMVDLVQQGQTVRILRHGKPVADLVPVVADVPGRVPSWKRPIEPLRVERLDGTPSARRVLDARAQARY